jgi:TetR/AcrR family transcriptional regulator, cholesterol catabolism regulator
VFAEQGFTHTTMRDIGKAAGTGAGTLYDHFTSKDEILLELMEAYYADILADLEVLIETDRDPLGKLIDMIGSGIRIVLERGDESRILLNDYPYVHGSPAFKTVVNAKRESTRIWLEVLEQATAAGQLRENANTQIIFSCLMGSIFSFLRFFDPRGRVPQDVYIEEMTAQLIDGLRRRDA